MSTAYDLYRDAELYLAEDNPRRAVAVLEQALELEPGDPGLQQLLARALLAFASLGRAEALLRDLVERYPSDGYSCELLALTLRRAGKYDDYLRYAALADQLR